MGGIDCAVTGGGGQVGELENLRVFGWRDRRVGDFLLGNGSGGTWVNPPPNPSKGGGIFGWKSLSVF